MVPPVVLRTFVSRDGAMCPSSRLKPGRDSLDSSHLLPKCDYSLQEEDSPEERQEVRECFFQRRSCQHSGFDGTVRSHKTKSAKHVLFVSLDVGSGAFASFEQRLKLNVMQHRKTEKKLTREMSATCPAIVPYEFRDLSVNTGSPQSHAQYSHLATQTEKPRSEQQFQATLARLSRSALFPCKTSSPLVTLSGLCQNLIRYNRKGPAPKLVATSDYRRLLCFRRVSCNKKDIDSCIRFSNVQSLWCLYRVFGV